MSGGGKKAVFLPLNLNDPTEHDRQRKLIQRGKSVDHKDSPDRSRSQAGTSKSEQKTPTQDQKDLIKQEHLRLKNEQKAQQKTEKEQQKLEKEAQKEQLKQEKEAQKAEQKQQKEAQKEQQKLEKEHQKIEKEQISASKNCFKAGLSAEKPSSPCLKTQKSLDIATIKHQQSFDGSHRPPARNSVDLQYTRDLLEATDIHETSPFSSTSSLAKVKNKK